MRVLFISILIACCAWMAFASEPTQQPFAISLSIEKPEIKVGGDVWVKVPCYQPVESRYGYER